MRVLLPAIAVLGALAFGQDAPMTREGNYWVRSTNGSISGPLPPRLQVAARAHIVLRGGASDQVVYRITQRVRTVNQVRARELMGDPIANRLAADLVRLSVVSGPTVVTEMEIAVPRQVSAALL